MSKGMYSRLFIFLILALNTSCYLNSNISGLDLTSSSESASPKTETTSPKVKVSDLPVNVPEGFPYYGKALMENSTGSATYELVSNTCKNLMLDSVTGIAFGLLGHANTESCSYFVKATVNGDEYLSELITLNFTSALVFNFSDPSVLLQKGSGFTTVNVTITPSPPYDSYLNYKLFSVTGTSLDQITGLHPSGTIPIYSGVSSKELNLSVPSGASFVTSEYQVMQFQNGLSLNLSLTDNVPLNFSAVAVGGSSTCAISSGKLYCWGNDSNGAVGNGGVSAPVLAPEQIGTAATWQSVTSGDYHTCGIESGKLYCWGLDNYGQQGNGAGSGSVMAPAQIGSSTTWQEVSAGDYHTCGIDSGKLYCWGSATFGQLGNGILTPDVTAPVQIGTSTTWQHIAASGNVHTCGIDAGKLYCWGYDYGEGRLGIGVVGSIRTTPAQVGTATNWQAITTSTIGSCGIESGKLYCWGYNSNGFVGYGTNGAIYNTPGQVGTLSTWTSVESGDTHTCGIASGKLYCWGNDANGQVGNGPNFSHAFSPALISEASDWQSVSGGYASTCAIRTNKLYCWGGISTLFTAAPDIGLSSAYLQSASPLLQESNWQTISMSIYFSCGIIQGKLYCWGDDNNGQLGNGPMQGSVATPSLDFIRIGIESNWQNISTGFDHACGIESGKLFCWGSDSTGKLGNGSSTANILSPERIGTASNWQAIAASGTFTCGIESGKLYCWGDDSYGQLGDGAPTVGANSPQQVGSLSNWQSISVSNYSLFSYSACGIESGKLYCWGSDANGQMGNGATTGNITSPSQVGSSAAWTTISISYHACGIDGGKLYCWGNDSNGQVGNGATTGNVATPEQIGVSTTWQKVQTGLSHTCGIDAGKLYCWGYDNFGQLGNGAPTAIVITPTQVGSVTNWSYMMAHDYSSCAGTSLGTVYCFGIGASVRHGTQSPNPIIVY